MHNNCHNNKPHIALILPDRIEHHVGGIGVQAKYLIENLKNDFDFSIHAFPDDTTIPNYFSVTNPLPKIQHGGLNTLTGQVAYLASITGLANRGHKPDLIHVLDYTEYLAGVYASKVLDVPLVASMQLSPHLMSEVGLFNSREPNSPDGMAIDNSMREMELTGLREAHHIIHVSNLYKKFFAQIPEFDRKSSYVPNGVDIDEYKKFTAIDLPGKARLKVIHIGRFSPQKNVMALINAEIPKDIDLIFVGESDPNSPIFNEVIKKTQTSENIHYIGPVYGESKVNVLSCADAVIIPSLHECHPIVMHEAMASKNVILHSGAGDMQEILTDDFAINCGATSESITQALKKLSLLKSDEIGARKKAGFMKVQNYTWQNAAQKTKDIYRKLLLKQ